MHYERKQIGRNLYTFSTPFNLLLVLGNVQKSQGKTQRMYGFHALLGFVVTRI